MYLPFILSVFLLPGTMGLDPHQPWHVPSEYLELYPNPIDKLPAPKHPYSPIGMPDIAVRVASE